MHDLCIEIAGGVFPGEHINTFCFVPYSVIVDGAIQEGPYVMSGWATRNQRLNMGHGIGSHMFPREGGKPLSKDAIPPKFLFDLRRELLALRNIKIIFS